MNANAMVAVVTDGVEYWTELFQGDNPQGTFGRHVDPRRWGSMNDARANSPWWPPSNPGSPAGEDQERMHRALCSWSSCSHKVVLVARIEG